MIPQKTSRLVLGFLIGIPSLVLLTVASSLWHHSASQNNAPAKNASSIGALQPINSAILADAPSAAHQGLDDPSFLRKLILTTDDYAVRIELRRRLFHLLRKGKRSDEAIQQLKELLDDIERQEGESMAQRVALAEANTLELQHDYAVAVRAYDLLERRYQSGPFTAEAMNHQAQCLLDSKEYLQAERVWARLTTEYADSAIAPWAWRKIALAQLLQSRFDDSLNTLDQMIVLYPRTEFEEYARMRRGYVQVKAERNAEAKQSYDAFLGFCPSSKYCRLAALQRTAIDVSESIGARASH